MPVGYLVNVVVLGVGAWFALAPPRRPEQLSLVAYIVGITFLNFYAVILLSLLLSTWFALPDLRGAGWALIGLAVVVAAGLLELMRRDVRSRRVIAAAAERQLGPGGPPSHRYSLVRMALLPFLRRRREVVRVRNLAYGRAGRRNLLDVYHRRDLPPSAPVLVHLHGGHYRMGHKNRQSLPLLYRFAAAGWVCISANYQLEPAVRHPEHLIDLKRIIAWIRTEASRFGADPEGALVLSGSSAGAHLSLLGAITQNDPRFQPGFADADTSVTAVVALGAYLGSIDGTDESSPRARVGDLTRPVLVAHGEIDTLVPVEAAREFVAELRAVSPEPVVYLELPGAQHGFDLFATPRFEAVVDAVERFTSTLSRSGRPSR